jgi:hypothetical protein
LSSSALPSSVASLSIRTRSSFALAYTT